MMSEGILIEVVATLKCQIVGIMNLRASLSHKLVEKGVIPIETKLSRRQFSNEKKNRFQSDFCGSSFLW